MLVLGCDLVFKIHVDEPDKPGRILVALTVSSPTGYPQLTAEWRGRWLQDTEGSAELDNLPDDVQNTAQVAVDLTGVFDGQQIVFEEAGNLRPGLWELAIGGSVGGSDVFPPVVCRQEIFSDDVVELSAIEGNPACTSDKGGEPSPPVLVWGATNAVSRQTALTQGEARAFPAAAVSTGLAKQLFVLVRRGTDPNLTRPGLVPVALAAFYQDQAGQPASILGGPITLEPTPVLEFRERLAKPVPADDTTWTLTGDTWVWFDIQSPVPLELGQTYHLGLLDPCPDPVNCPSRNFLLLYAAQMSPSFRSSSTNATALPDLFVGTATATNLAPVAAFAVSR
jgi:hypothetical protein